MQLGEMIQILFIVSLSNFALYLVLGFPVAFLLVELLCHVRFHIKWGIRTA